MDQKKKDTLEKVANAMADGAKKVDSLVSKRDVLGSLTAPVVLGLVIILVVALIQQPVLLVLGGLGVAVGLAPALLKKGMEAKEKMDARKASKGEAKAEVKAEDKK